MLKWAAAMSFLLLLLRQHQTNLFKLRFNIVFLTCSPSSVRPTLVSTGPWHCDGALVSPRQSPRAPFSSTGTPLSPGQSWTWSCPWSPLVRAFDSTKTAGVTKWGTYKNAAVKDLVSVESRRSFKKNDITHCPLFLQFGPCLHVVKVQPSPVPDVSPAALFAVYVWCRAWTSWVVKEVTDQFVSIRLRRRFMNVKLCHIRRVLHVPFDHRPSKANTIKAYRRTADIKDLGTLPKERKIWFIHDLIRIVYVKRNMSVLGRSIKLKSEKTGGRNLK